MMDTNNLVVKLCVEGMQAESEGRIEDAHKLFEEAWTACRDDYDACVAAHYLARHQDNPQATFEWNREALNRANLCDDRVQGFYSSLYLNMAHSYETLGNQAEARKYYKIAKDKLDYVPDGEYKNGVRNGIVNGYKRMGLVDE